MIDSGFVGRCVHVKKKKNEKKKRYRLNIINECAAIYSQRISLKPQSDIRPTACRFDDAAVRALIVED